jgi:hypothetical protein
MDVALKTDKARTFQGVGGNKETQKKYLYPVVQYSTNVLYNRRTSPFESKLFFIKSKFTCIFHFEFA